MNYILQKDDGSRVIVGGRNSDRATGVKVIYGMDKIKIGSVIGFIYTGDKDTGKGNPAKLIEIRYLGEQKPEVADAFKAMFNVEEVVETSNAEPVEENDGQETPNFD